jgi:sortase (surface protein transpeptidase)
MRVGDRKGDARGSWPRVLALLLGVGILASCSTSVAGLADAPSTGAPVTSAPATPSPSSSPSPTPEAAATATADPTAEPATNVAGAVAPPAPAASGYRIEIARLGINLPIAEGDVPRDIDRAQTPEYFAFHLPGTSMFDAGNTYIYAHARVGMFLSLWNARVGDVVIVRTPKGPREYVVAEVHPRVPPTEVSWAGPTQDTRLTLQTSTGPYGTDPRFVVVARPR